MEHFTEQELERYAFTPERHTEAQRAHIDTHLAVCAWCYDTWFRFKQFYEAYAKESEKELTDTQKELVEQILRHTTQLQLIPTHRQPQKVNNTIDATYEIIRHRERPLPQRIIRYIALHPIRAVGGTSLAAAIVTLALLSGRPSGSDNPTFAEVKNYVLTVFNKEGKTLWTKSVVGIPNGTTETKFSVSGDVRRVLLVSDIDDDERNEVLLSGVLHEGSYAADTLWCFGSDGQVRWKIGTGYMLSFGDSTVLQHSRTVIEDFFTVKKNNSSRLQLFILARDRVFSPTKLFEVDPKGGAELQSYFNRGQCKKVMTYDIDNDGVKEIIFAGINDGYNRACLAVLDPSHINGFAPVPDRFIPVNSERAQEKYYVLFPMSVFGQRYGIAPYNEVHEVELTSQQQLLVHVKELVRDFEGNERDVQLLYSLTSTMQVFSIAAGDGFFQFNDYLVKKGILKESLLPHYVNQLKDSLQYWDGGTFVHVPTVNKWYVDVRPIP
jgi:hypothetical protein